MPTTPARAGGLKKLAESTSALFSAPRVLLSLALLAAGVAAADIYTTVTFSESQTCTAGTCTGTAPTSNASGASLNGVNAYRLSVCAANGQTLSGAGTMQAYWCDATSTLCMRTPKLDQAVTASGVQCQTFPDFVVPYVSGALDTVDFEASGVTVNGGSALTERIYTHVERYK